MKKCTQEEIDEQGMSEDEAREYADDLSAQSREEAYELRRWHAENKSITLAKGGNGK